MKTEIQETELYQKFKKALNITMDMRADDNPFVVKCCEIATEHASQFQQEWIPVEEETAREPIQDALYATGRFTKDECDVLSDGILRYINDANLVFVPQPYNPTKS